MVPNTSMYIWFKPHERGIPETQVPFPFMYVITVTGMGQWVKVRVEDPVTQEELPKGFILSSTVQHMLDNYEKH